MTDIISIVNIMQQDKYPDGTISKLALKPEDFHGGSSIPFMGAYVQLYPGVTLPAEADVNAYQSTYDSIVLQAKQEAEAKAALPDLATQVAHLTSAIVSNGITLPNDVIAAANIKLATIDSPIIEVEKLDISKF